MSLFDSPAQIVGLFIAASLVSIGLIFLINAEQDSRLALLHDAQDSQIPIQKEEKGQERSSDGHSISGTQTSGNFLKYFQKTLTSLLSKLNSPPPDESLKRSKRAAPQAHEESDKNENNEILGHSSHKQPFHKIRHAMKKLDGGGLEGDVVLRMILDSKPIPPQEKPQRPPIKIQPDYEKFFKIDKNNHFQPFTQHQQQEHFLTRDNMQKTKIEDENPSDINLSSEHRKISKIDSINAANADVSKKADNDNKISVLKNNKKAKAESEIIDEDDESKRSEDSKISSIIVDSSETSESYVLESTRVSREETDQIKNIRSYSDDDDNNDLYKTNKSITEIGVCYKTDDMLIVIAITCSLNFAFVLLIWACVRYFSQSGAKEKDFTQLECEDGGESVLFPDDDLFWMPGSSLKNRKTTPKSRSIVQSKSLYNVPNQKYQIFKKSYSHSMEDLRYVSS